MKLKSNSLHFSNFRKFEEFSRINFNDINFLVGKNNSGKSTFVKAIMLVYGYLQQRNLSVIDFNSPEIADLNIPSFSRIVHKSDNILKRDEVEISMELHDYRFDLMFGRHDDNSKGLVQTLSCSYWGPYRLEISPEMHILKLICEEGKVQFSVEDDLEKSLNEQLKALFKEKSEATDQFSYSYITVNDRIRKVEGQIAKLKNKEKKIKGFSIEFDYRSEDLLQVITALSNAISSLPMSDEIDYYDTINTSNYPPDDLDPNYSLDYEYEKNDVFHYDSDQDNWLVRLEMNVEQHEEFQILYYAKNDVIRFLSGIKNFIEKSEIAYLPATLQKQSCLFSIKDKGNVLAQILHFSFQNYYLYASQTDAEQDNFIEKWMQEFEIGDKYSIQQVEGEAYKVEIKKNNVWISLADKGMGAIQAMLLILRIGSIIRQQKSGEKKFIVILEEPELNLHPALQSKLCNMFYEVYEKWGVEFIIETHSEYLIRKTQLFVKEKELEIAPNENPYTILYFNDDLRVWSMEYREDGKFKNEFGSGFFDETRKIVKKML